MSNVDKWTREKWSPGGGDAFLFYVIYGDVDVEVPSLPEGSDVRRLTRAEHGPYLANFEEGYVWDQLVKDDPELASKVKQSGSCLIVQGTVADPPSLAYLRDTIGFITSCLDRGGVAVHDLQVMKWWTPEAWRREVSDPDDPQPHLQTYIMYSREEGGIWLHTRGMRKFGRPDLSIRDIAAEDFDSAVQLCERLIGYQAAGGLVRDGQTLRMPGVDRVFVARVMGDEDDEDFNNVHLELEELR